MSRSLPWFWIVLLGLLLLAPSPAGRLLLDLIGGLTLTLLLLPLLFGAAGFVAWQVLQRRARTCAVCGLRAIAQQHCPACGSPYPSAAGSPPADLDASSATIDVEVIDDSS